jgi:hypothetical protein
MLGKLKREKGNGDNPGKQGKGGCGQCVFKVLHRWKEKRFYVRAGLFRVNNPGLFKGDQLMRRTIAGNPNGPRQPLMFKGYGKRDAGGDRLVIGDQRKYVFRAGRFSVGNKSPEVVNGVIGFRDHVIQG